MMESLQQEARVTNVVRSGEKIFIPGSTTASPSARKLQIRDAVSWSVCFGVVAMLTGALLLYNIGVTMSTVTSLLFYFSLAGFIFFVARAILLRNARGTAKDPKSSGLN